MSDFDVKVQNQNTSITGAGANGGGSSAPVTQPTIQDIFNRKMTREQVGSEFGQAGLDLFDKANTDGQDGISEDEYNAYNNPQPQVEDLTSKSGKRTAPGGVYTVVKGDTLSKIAADFGVALIPLYDSNRDVIGNNINKLEIGMQIRIKTVSSSNPTNPTTSSDNSGTQTQTTGRTEAEKEELRNTLRQYAKQLKPSEPPKIFVGMTRAQAEQAGGATLEVFNQYANGADKISNTAFVAYQKTLMPELSKENLTQMLNGIVGDKFDKKDLEILVDEVLPTLIDITGTKQSNKANEISGDVQSLLIDLTNDTSIPPGEKSKQFYEALKSKIEADKNDENGSYSFHKNRLKNGEFSEFEKNFLGLSKDVQLTDEQIEQYATLAVKAEFILPVVNALKDAVNRQDDNALMTLIMNVGKDFFGNSDVQGILQIYGLSGILDEINKRAVTNNWAEKGTLDLNETSDFVGQLYAASIIQNADEEHVQLFIENNADNLDIIQEAAKAVMNNMEDGDKKTALQNAINNAVNNVQNGTIGHRPTTTTASSSGKETAVQGYQAYTSNLPQNFDNPAVTNTIQLNDASRNYYANAGIKTQTTEQAQQAFRASLRAMGTIESLKALDNLPATERKRYIGQIIGSASIEDIKELVKLCSNNSQVKSGCIEKLQQLGNTTRIILMAVCGEDVQKFMMDEHLVKKDELKQYLEMNPADRKYFEQLMEDIEKAELLHQD